MRILLGLLLFVFAPQPVFAETVPSDEAFLLHLIRLGWMDSAELEALRLAARSPAGELAPELHQALADGYLAANQTERALSHLVEVEKNALPSEALDRLRLQMGWLYLSLRDVEPAMVLLARVRVFGTREDLTRSASLLECSALVLRDQPEAVMSCLEASSALTCVTTDDQLKLTRELERLARKRPIGPKAAWLASALIPGLGQALAGQPVDGVNALLINAAWITGGIVLALQGFYPEAVLVGLSGGTRYYTSNLQRARSASEAARDRYNQQAMAQVLRSLAAMSCSSGAASSAPSLPAPSLPAP